MGGKATRVTGKDFVERYRQAGPRTRDDVSITVDGRRLDSREAVLEWLDDIGPVLEEVGPRWERGELDLNGFQDALRARLSATTVRHSTSRRGGERT